MLLFHRSLLKSQRPIVSAFLTGRLICISSASLNQNRDSFFNQDDFCHNPQKPMPPKKPIDFSTSYKRRPLFWMIKGTDVLQERNRLCIYAAVASFFIMCISLVHIYRKYTRNPDHPIAKLLKTMPMKDSPEREEMFNLQRRLMDMDLFSNFLRVNIQDYGEIKRYDPKIDINPDNIRHAGHIIPNDRRSTPDDTQKNLKEVDQTLRQLEK